MKNLTKGVLAPVLSIIVVIGVAGVFLALRTQAPSAPTGAFWPLATTGTTFTSPTSAAYSLATKYAGMKNVVIDSSLQSSEETWTVVLQSGQTGPHTTVTLVKDPSTKTWWVTYAVAQDITLESPHWNQVVSSPIHLSGQSTAFEALINGAIRLRATAKSESYFYAMGGANGILGTFSKTISLVRSAGHPLVIFLKELSAKDGGVLEFSAVPIFG